MTKTMKQSIAIIAVIAQLLILLPFSIIPVNAEESASVNERATPVLNETVVGTLSFQSFNFLGDNATGEDATEYQTTFYYTDDFFSRSAINEIANQQVMKWSDLEDVSMATCSMDFSLAAMTSSDDNVVAASSNSWNNTDYSNKDKNVIAFLGDCGFTGIETYGLTEKPTIDSIGYTIGSKHIRVWDDATKENKDYTVVAVGIRGAGYDSEWADNVKIGTQGNGANVVRHEGFDNSAKTVCASIESYIKRKNIDSNVKYWVTGFSRAAAVANLTAGYLTDGESVYHAAQKDIYGYTWECPQAASTNENALHYKNIHNIINPLDAVPKVSPSGFNHQRLGIDYEMPSIKNLNKNKTLNTQYYNRMVAVLESICVGSEAGQADRLVNDIKTYPYNDPMTIYTLTAGQLIDDAVDGTLTDNFGTVKAEKKTYRWGIQTGGNVDYILGDKNNDGSGSDWYVDDFVNNLVDVFLHSTAWDRDYPDSSTNVISHRTRFVDNYQQDFQNVLGYLLDYSGPAFLGLIDAVVGAVGNQLSATHLLENGGLALAFTNFYNYPKSTYQLGVPPFIDPWIGNPLWVGSTRKDVLIDEAKPVVRNVMKTMTVDKGYSHPSISWTQFSDSLDKLVEVVIELYADELDKYGSQYFGTTLHYLWKILAVHEQETVLSWIMSLDSNHMNRSYKTVTVPLNSKVELHEFRSRYNEEPNANSEAPIVATFENGVQIFSKDQRIYKETSGTDLIIRYPASLTIRADVTVPEGTNDLKFKVGDYQISSETVNVSAGKSQYETLSDNNYTNITNDIRKTNAKAINSLSDSIIVPMSKYDVLHIWCNGTDSYNTNNNTWHIDKDIYVNVVVEGQFIHDGKETTFTNTVSDDNGTPIDLDSLAEQFEYTSTKGTKLSGVNTDSHIARNFTIYVPKVVEDHYVEKLFITDSSDELNRQLSSADTPYHTSYEESGPYTEFSYGNASTDSEILSQTDRVYHVFYSGSPMRPESVTRIIDFNGKMVLATHAENPEVERSSNGAFDLDEDKNATYQLNSGKLSNQTVTLTSAYSSADVATIKGIYDNKGKAVKKKVTVVPASSIYFNDKLAEKPLHVSDTAGYSAEIENSVSTDAKATSGTFYFTFYGTGIDVYCTTHDDGGYISTALFKASQESECVKANREGTAKMIRNYSSEDYYNTPTISFTGLPARTYTLKIMANENAQYKLDGVRVYNSVEKNSAAEAELNKTGEANATYLNLRSVLLNDEGIGGFTVTNEILPSDVDPETVSGVLYIDDVEKIVTKPNIDADGNTAEKPVDLYQTQFDVYKGNGPKNEIYLDGGQALTFQLNVARFDENTRVYIGLSVPKTGNGSVTINGKDISPAVTSVMDMYYPVEFDLNNAEGNFLSITLKNVGVKGDVISVTNLKITGIADLISDSVNTDAPETVKATRALFAPVTLKTIRMAANNGADPEAETVESEEPDVTEEPEDPTVTEDPTETEEPDDGSLVIDEPEVTETPTPSVTPDTPAETGNTIQKVIQSITRSISSFIKSIFRR